MNPIQQELTTERVLKKFLKESDYVFLEKLGERILSALADKKAEHDERETQRVAREEKRHELMALISAEGFSLTDLLGSDMPGKSPKRKPKYEYVENGETKRWSGVGRTPAPLQQALDAGKKLNDFLISPDNSTLSR
ncbi:H-NS family nucleoid-associated regulatory protein [Serratia fonticola]|uniref:H-NS family histone-like protein n=1 Tax=Serratia fonticola TaxID=47917 RepID=UPI00301E4163